MILILILSLSFGRDFMSLGYSAHLSLGMRYPTGSAIGLKETSYHSMCLQNLISRCEASVYASSTHVPRIAHTGFGVILHPETGIRISSKSAIRPGVRNGYIAPLSLVFQVLEKI